MNILPFTFHFASCRLHVENKNSGSSCQLSQEHIHIACRVVTDLAVWNESSEMSYECYWCYSTFRTQKACDQHEDAVHPYRCEDCDCTYRNSEDLDNHIDEEHTIWYQCEICPNYGRSSRFRTEHSLDQHVQAAAGHQNYCYGCKRDFTSPNALAQHLKSSVHVGRNVKCPWCPQMVCVATFSSKCS